MPFPDQNNFYISQAALQEHFQQFNMVNSLVSVDTIVTVIRAYHKTQNVVSGLARFSGPPHVGSASDLKVTVESLEGENKI